MIGHCFTHIRACAPDISKRTIAMVTHEVIKHYVPRFDMQIRIEIEQKSI